MLSPCRSAHGHSKSVRTPEGSQKVALWPLLLFSAVFGFGIVIGAVSGDRPVEEAIGKTPLASFGLGRIASGLLMLWQSFVVKDILEDHLTPSTDGALPSMFVERVQLSGVATFFFSIFYLQYTINRYLRR